MVRTVSQDTGTQGHECAELTPEKVESESTSSNVSAAYSQVSTPLLRRRILHTSGSWACSICAVMMLYCLIDSDNYDQGKEKRQERGRRISLLMIRWPKILRKVVHVGKDVGKNLESTHALLACWGGYFRCISQAQSCREPTVPPPRHVHFGPLLQVVG